MKLPAGTSLGQLQDARRTAWASVYGPIPDGFWLGHRCGIVRCIDPAHGVLRPDSELERHIEMQAAAAGRPRPAV